MFQTMTKVYKLKFTGIISEPIYYLCTSNEIVNEILEKITAKYKICKNGTFKFNSKELEQYSPLEKCGFYCGNFKPLTPVKKPAIRRLFFI